jgi:hypothetical protein
MYDSRSLEDTNATVPALHCSPHYLLSLNSISDQQCLFCVRNYNFYLFVSLYFICISSDLLFYVFRFITLLTLSYIKVKVPRNRPEGLQGGGGGVRGIALLFLDLGARRRWVASTTPRPLYPRERPGTHCIGGWVGPRARLDVCEKSRPHRDSIPGPSSP